jgi:phosphatidate cytidylyltransferase
MRQRIITALILLAIVFFFLWLGGIYFSIFISLVLMGAGIEWCRLFKSAGYSANTWFVVFAILGYILVSLIDKEGSFPFYVLGFIFIALLFAIHLFEANSEKAVFTLLIQICGVFYLSEFGLSFIRLRNLSNGGWWLFFFIAITALGDTAALFVGKPWGKHKLGKRVSPNKSWEGLIAGVLTAGLTGLTFSLLAKQWFVFKPLWSVLLGSGVYLISVIGDMAISMIKRWAGEKNSSELLPGHGGILDRIDSHLWSSTLGYHLLVLFLLRL